LKVSLVINYTVRHQSSNMKSASFSRCYFQYLSFDHVVIKFFGGIFGEV